MEKETEPKKSKDNWDKFSAIAGVFVPIAILYASSQYSSALKESETRLHYVELAVGILRADPNPSSAELRDWAVKIVNKNSPVPLEEKAQRELLDMKFEVGLYGTNSKEHGCSVVSPK